MAWLSMLGEAEAGGGEVEGCGDCGGGVGEREEGGGHGGEVMVLLLLSWIGGG